MEKGEVTEKYLTYFDKTLEVNSLLKFKEVFKYLEQEGGAN